MTRSQPITELTTDLVLVNEDGRRFKISAITSRIVVIKNESGDFVESVSHAFAMCKYRKVAQ